MNAMLGLLKAKAKKAWVLWNNPELGRLPCPPREDKVHLKAAMDWLSEAQDVMGSGGVSTLYDLRHNTWTKEYRETTGYIIETFVEYYRLSAEQEYLERAVRMGD